MAPGILTEVCSPLVQHTSFSPILFFFSFFFFFPLFFFQFYEQLKTDFCSDLVAWTSLLLNQTNPPLVHSISYGWQGDLSQLNCHTSEVQVGSQCVLARVLFYFYFINF
jgi:hypothetical protein